MAKRILSTVFLWLFLFAVIWFLRTAGAVALVAAVSVLTLREFYRLMNAAGHAPFAELGMALGGLVTLSPLVEAHTPVAGHLVLPLSIVVVALASIFARQPDKRVEALSSTLFGLGYVALMLGYLVRLVLPRAGDALGSDPRLVLCLWVVAVCKFCDVGALLTGLAIGRHKMAPLTSPKKTWEGAVGGVLVSMGIGALVAWLGRGVLPASFTPAKAAILALPLAILAIISDLVESVIKRHASIKDSGGGVPGIGGMFDLSDSLILTAPVAYLLFGLA